MFVFVYGTLTDPERVATVLETAVSDATDAFVGRATLEGLHRVDGRYPTLAPGGSVAGRLLSVDEASLERLDRYEGTESGLYVRAPVSEVIGAADDRCWVYVGDPGRLDVDVTWPGRGPLRDRIRSFVSESTVIVANGE